MNIALVSQFYHPIALGGAEISVQQIAEGLVATGCCVNVATTQMSDLPDREAINGVQIHRFPLPNIYTWHPARHNNVAAKLIWHAIDSWNPLVYRGFIRWLRSVKPDVLHTNTMAGFSSSIWQAAHDVKIPVVHTLRDYYLLCYRSTMFCKGKNCENQCASCRILSIPRRHAARKVDAVVGISRFILYKHLRAEFFTEAKIKRVIHNSFQSAIHSPHVSNPATGRLHLGFLGRIHPSKGIEQLLKCLSTFQLGTVKLFVAGEGKADYFNYLHTRYASENIQFLGFIKPETLFAKCDILVIPSLWHEPLGRIILESYAYGVPVIAPIRGGCPEIVEEGITGFVYDPEQCGSLIQILQKILATPDLLPKLSAEALRKASEFTREVIIQQYMSVYSGVVSR